MTPWTVAGQAPLSMEILHTRILEWVAVPFSSGSSQSRDWTQVSRIASGFFTVWGTRKPKNTGVDSLAYPFSRRSSWPRNQTRDLLHCRWILYQLSYQGSPAYVHIWPETAHQQLWEVNQYLDRCLGPLLATVNGTHTQKGLFAEQNLWKQNWPWNHNQWKAGCNLWS